ncbi:hypothetical protein F5Y11DRAFT_309141 [Daldinia sp. FL1419]|nr:hypothetical protein F5Y11DRAFT_309141 [Daldinia sp. FL1419]
MPVTRKDLIYESVAAGATTSILLITIMAYMILFRFETRTPYVWSNLGRAAFSLFCGTCILYGMIFRFEEWEVLLSRLWELLGETL